MAIYFSDVMDVISDAVSKLSNINHHYHESDMMITLLNKIIYYDDYNSTDGYADYEWKSESRFGKFGETSKWGHRNYSICVYEYNGEIGEICVSASESITYLQGFPSNKEKYIATGELFYHSSGVLTRFYIDNGQGRKIYVEL